MRMRIIGVDPGLNRTGYAVIEDRGGRWVAVEGGIARTDPEESLELRVLAIYRDIREVLEELRPEAMALEELHSNYEFPRTAILMGHARGAVCLAAAEFGITVTGYAPSRVKNAVTGSGGASKEQVQRAVVTQLGLASPPKPLDVTDAFALAVCHAMVARSPVARVK
ncbi:MAG: crossover junction endodeoxyribonuclease RuvC [SAR202 cluster bacterium]|nr:crossover junction endodeoxyribonuclease RuvC [SAR202 cluster bacterium]